MIEDNMQPFLAAHQDGPPSGVNYLTLGRHRDAASARRALTKNPEYDPKKKDTYVIIGLSDAKEMAEAAQRMLHIFERYYDRPETRLPVREGREPRRPAQNRRA